MAQQTRAALASDQATNLADASDITAADLRGEITDLTDSALLREDIDTIAELNAIVADATIVTQGGALGTPASGVATNLTGTAAGLTAGNVTTNANLTGHVTSTGNAAVLGSFTAAQLNTAVSDATLLESGGALGTPSSGLATNLTGTAAGLTAGAVEGTGVLSTGEAGGTKFLREDGDGTCSWQTPAGGGSMNDVSDDTTPQLGGNLDLNDNGICFSGSNTTGGTLTKGTPVYINGASNSIAEADANGSGTLPAVGIVAADIANSASGLVVVLGTVSGIDTSSFAADDPIYVSDTAGTLTNTVPASGETQKIGRVITSHATTGSIFVVVFQDGQNIDALIDTTASVGADKIILGDAGATPAFSGIARTVTNFIADHNLATKTGSGAANIAIPIAISDETTALTTGTAKLTYYMPAAFTLTDIHACVTTAPTGATLIIDVNDGGTSIMTTNKLVIDVSENDTTTAATAPTLTDTALAAGAAITFDIDQVGSTIAGAGAKVTLIGYWT